MDELLKFHFDYFDTIIGNELTPEIEIQISKIKEKLKNTFNQESKFYTMACHYLDKKFDEYIENKKD
jgi:hypothetical protein